MELFNLFGNLLLFSFINLSLVFPFVYYFQVLFTFFISCIGRLIVVHIALPVMQNHPISKSQPNKHMLLIDIFFSLINFTQSFANSSQHYQNLSPFFLIPGTKLIPLQKSRKILIIILSFMFC